MSAVLPHLEITPQRPHWLAGARGFEPPSCRNCVLPTPCTRRRLPPLLGSQCNAPRAPAATPRMRAKGPAARGGRGGPPGPAASASTALYGTLARLAQRYPPCGSPALPESDGHRTHRKRDRWV